MITERDITKLKEVFATREEHQSLKEEVVDLRIQVGEIEEKIDGIDVKLDRFLGSLDNVQRDNEAGAAVLYRHERSLQALARHIGITLPA